MKYVEKRDRSQISFLPECVEDYIDEENPVRVIDAFVDSLDMEALGFQKAKPAQTGRPALCAVLWALPGLPCMRLSKAS